MPVRTSSVSFPPLRGGGPRTAQSTVVFPREVLRATAGLTNYSVGFSGDDHNIGNLKVLLDPTVNGDTVTVNVTFGLRDWSGNWDDDYQGDIEFAVIAELASATAPPPRTDVVVADAELNQATQFFESLRHLDSEHALPDNSIRLVGGKNLGIRLYVDYDAANSPAPIALLSGELRLTATSGASTTLAPLQTIVPRAQVAIDRGVFAHTLNFMVPGIWCHGQLEMAVDVFDSASPTSRSVAFERTLRFLDVTPLQVHGVAIHYTGQGLDLPAPAIADVVSSVDFTERVYPVGEVVIAGYQSQDYDRDLRPSDDGDDTPGYDGILDLLEDLRGGGDEVFLALLPNGIDVSIDTTGWSIDGIERNGVGVSFVDDEKAVAHEIGHAFGREHAPCDSDARCDSPESPDDSYPKYGTYPSDSIGEYGFDPIAKAVLDPASTFDFMGYSSVTWTSPYTYTALMGALPPTGGGPSSDASSHLMRRRRSDAVGENKGLFLRLQIGPGEDVTLEPSFTHEAAVVPLAGCGDWHVEQRDVGGRVLSCIALTVPRRCGCNGRSRRVRQAIPRSAGGDTLAVVHDGKDVLVEAFGSPPKVTASAKISGDSIDVQWKGEKGLWVLVQGLDRAGIWRGLAPRTQSSTIVLPAAALAKHRFARLRLLAVRALATTVVELPYEPPVVVASSTIITHMVAPAILKAWIVGDDGPDLATVLWSDEHGAQLGRGHTLDLRDRKEVGIVRVTAADSGRLIDPRVIVLDPVKGHLAITSDRAARSPRTPGPPTPPKRARKS